MKIYLDNCALGRLFDTQEQSRIAAEAAAIRSVVNRVVAGSYSWVGSEALREEISRNSDPVRRSDTLRLLSFATEILSHTTATRDRTQTLQRYGMKQFDAQHTAFAEAVRADALLTTDDRLVRLAARLRSQQVLGLDVLNPVDWLRKVAP